MGRYPKEVIDPAGRKRRRARLEAIGGMWPAEINNLTVAGRTRVIRILEDQAATQLRIKAEAPHYYSEALHIEILKAISEERKAIAALQKRIGDRPTQLTLIKV